MKPLILIASLIALNANAFELKDFNIGQAMSECPYNFKEINPEGYDKRCILLRTGTFGGVPLEGLMLELFQGHISAITVSIKTTYNTATYNDIYNALILKNGPAVYNREYAGTHLWRLENQSLFANLLQGVIVAMDRYEFKIVNERQAQKSRTDI